MSETTPEKQKMTTQEQLQRMKYNKCRAKAKIAKASRRVNQIIIRRNKSKLKRKNRKI